MLDIRYPGLMSFLRDCAACGINGARLLDSGEYVRVQSGEIVAGAWL